MDTHSLCGDLYHQGYAQAPPPGTTPVQVLPPTQASTSVSIPLAPPGVEPSPTPTPAVYYGMYPPHIDRWNAYPMPAVEPHPHHSFVEPHPHHSFPPSALTYSPYGNYPCYQETFPYMHGHLGPPQAYMPPPRRGSDVTRFRKRRQLLPDQNLWAKGAFHADSRAFITPFTSNPMANNAHSFNPLCKRRIKEASANPFGKKRKTEEKFDGRPIRNDVLKEGDKSTGKSWSKAKRKKGRKPRAEGDDLDSNADAGGTGSAKKGEGRKCERSPLTEEQAREATTWLELHRDARKRVEEFLLSSESSLLTAKERREGATQSAACGVLNAVVPGPKEGIQDEVGSGAGADVGVNTDAAILAVDLLVTSKENQVKTISADNTHASHHDETGEQPSAELLVLQEKVADFLQHPPHTDAPLVNGAHSLHSDALLLNSVSRIEYNKAEDVKSAREDALQVDAELLPDLEPGRIGEPASLNEEIGEVREQKSLIQSVDNAHNVERKHQEASTEDEVKDREEKSFEFFTKLLEENFALRKLYVENCNDGAFECLMCYSKTKKKFTSLASLVSHASNVLKTKKLPEHRGYGRAVCSLFGWDPSRIPNVPIKSSVSKSIVHIEVPIHETASVVGNGALILDDSVELALSNTGENVLAADTVETASASLAVSCTPFDDTVQGRLGSELDKNFLEVGAADYAPVNTSIKQVLLDDNGACGVPHMYINEEASMEEQENVKDNGMSEGGGTGVGS